MSSPTAEFSYMGIRFSEANYVELGGIFLIFTGIFLSMYIALFIGKPTENEEVIRTEEVKTNQSPPSSTTKKSATKSPRVKKTSSPTPKKEPAAAVEKEKTPGLFYHCAS